MRKLLFCLTAAVAVAGCTSESDHPASSAASSQAQPAKASLATAIDRATGRSSVASMPDRGALLAFDPVAAPSREGATALYPIRLSEAHALNAAAPGGTIELATPTGDTMRFAYASHTEDTLGNWTWVGNTADGLSAVITFGKDAVFGQIALAGAAPLQLTTRNGRTWLGVIDSSRALSAHLLRKGKPDVLIPRIAAAGAAIAAGGKAAPAQPGFAVKASPANTVDVALGFTPGMITTYGSVSGVNTRLTNLVAVANAAYQRSQVTPRVRLVHTMQVNYTETNSNETALNALTGFVCNPSCTPTSVPAELQPLRNARDQFGADLVSLVRPLRAPQNEGCGIAWLVGGGGIGDTEGNNIDNTYAPYGYSVVSDGQDPDETDGNNYLCYPETLAHELGHNMGQAHNVQDSGNSPGRHSYSYGYRETTNTGFFTIMAYPLTNSSQVPISYFSNPNVNDAGTGRVTGTATADNARSLNQTMPLVAQFRAAVVPFPSGARKDFNGDGLSEIYWKESATGESFVWRLNSRTITGSGRVHLEPDNSWKVIGFGDFNGDGKADVFWRHSGNGQNYIHLMDGLQKLPGSGFSQFVTDLNWSVATFGDFDGDGDSDIYWKNSVTGACIIWYMQGLLPSQTRVVHTEPDASWRIIGAGDFDGDSISDVLWHHSGNGMVFIHRMSPTGINTSGTGAAGIVSDLNWKIVATGDFNGDSRSDIFWRHSTNGQNYVWTMNGLTPASVALSSIVSDLNWKVAASGDYNGDGRDDVFWRNSADGSNFIHMLNGASLLSDTGPVQAVASQNWQIMGNPASD